MKATTEKLGFVRDLASTVWPYRPITAPIFYAMLVYMAAGLLRVADKWFADVPLWFKIVVPAAVAVFYVFFVLFTSTNAKRTGFFSLIAFVSAGWVMWTMFTSPYTLVSAGVAFGLVVALGPFYGVIRFKSAEEETKAEQEQLAKEQSQGVHPWSQIFDHSGYPGMRIISQTKNRAGYTIHAKTPPKTKATWQTISGATDLLEANAAHVLGEDFPEGTFTVHKGAVANDVMVIVDTEDILSKTLPSPMTDRGPQTITEPKRIGLLKNGEPSMLDITSGHAMVVAASGGGKSGFANWLAKNVTESGDAIMWMSACDKAWSLMGPWLKPWLQAEEGEQGRPCIWPATDEEESVKQLLAFYQLVDIRQVSPRGGADKIRVSTRRPQLVYLLEEAPSLLESNESYPTHRPGESLTPGELILKCLRLGRSEAARIYLITQRGTVTFLGNNGGDIKSLFDIRIGMRTNGAVDTMAVFDSPPKNMDLTKLEHPGSFWIQQAQSSVMPGKVEYVDPEVDVPILAKRHGQWVPEFEPNVLKAWGELYSERFSEERFGEVEKKFRQFLAHEDEGFNEEFEMVSVVSAAKSSDEGKEMDNSNMEIDPVLMPPPLPKAWQDWHDKQAEQEKLGPDAPDLNDDSWLDGLDDVASMWREQMPKAPEAVEPAPQFGRPGDDPRRIEMLKFIDAAGSQGVASKDIQAHMESQGNPVHRVTVQKWLADDVRADLLVKPSHGMYASKRYYK